MTPWLQCGLVPCDCPPSVPPPFVSTTQVTNIQSDALFILLVEKDAAFMRLAEDRFYNDYPSIIITAKGQPDVATRWDCPCFGLWAVFAFRPGLQRRRSGDVTCYHACTGLVACGRAGPLWPAGETLIGGSSVT